MLKFIYHSESDYTSAKSKTEEKMNGNNFYYNSVYETPEMRLEKKRKQRKFFSRFFIALFVYQLVFQLLSSLVYLGVNIFLSAEKYEAFVADPVASIVSSSIVQYGIALPLFLLITRGMDTAERREKKKITFGEGVIFISVAELMMFVGNIIGNILNSSIGVLIGDTPTNNLTNIVESTPVWLLFIVMVVIAPIAEELYSAV
jgi:membrane protease YdiL (CAAX protease family)